LIFMKYSCSVTFEIWQKVLAPIEIIWIIISRSWDLPFMFKLIEKSLLAGTPISCLRILNCR
jgi:hypothetical protein